MNRNALGVKMTGSALVSFVLGAAQVPLWLLVTFPSSFLPDSLEQFIAGPELLFVILNFIHKNALLLWI